MKCLLKKTKFGKLAHCKDDFDLDRYSGIEVMKCLRNHKVRHCVECKGHPKN